MPVPAESCIIDATGKAPRRARAGPMDTFLENRPMASLDNPTARADIVNRLKRAEGQLRGVQRMVEEGESCVKVAQQLSAVRKALDSTYVRMTVCLVEQEVQARIGGGDQTQAKLAPLLAEMERLIGRIT
jgi:CsoR family transcriptional regulator, copper-sensing transcriptional repressor